MRKYMKFISLALAMVLCLGLLSACSTDETDDSGTAETEEPAGTEEPAETEEPSETEDASGAEEPAETEDSETSDESTLEIGEVTAISEDGTLSLTLYALVDGAEEPQDYAAIDMSLYEASTWTAEYLPGDGTEVYFASDGELTEAETADIAVGDMLALYKTDAGEDAIAIYRTETAE